MGIRRCSRSREGDKQEYGAGAGAYMSGSESVAGQICPLSNRFELLWRLWALTQLARHSHKMHVTLQSHSLHRLDSHFVPYHLTQSTLNNSIFTVTRHNYMITIIQQ